MIELHACEDYRCFSGKHGQISQSGELFKIVLMPLQMANIVTYVSPLF